MAGQGGLYPPWRPPYIVPLAAQSKTSCCSWLQAVICLAVAQEAAGGLQVEAMHRSSAVNSNTALLLLLVASGVVRNSLHN